MYDEVVMIRVEFHVKTLTNKEIIDKEREMTAWCYENFGEDGWVIGPDMGCFSFDNEDQAMWFKLRWT